MESPQAKPTRVLMVCLGNICRSPAAEEMLRQIASERGMAHAVAVDSAGTGGYHIGLLPDQRMCLHARRRGMELTHRCRQVDVEDFLDFDMIIGMDASNVANLRRLAPSVEAARKVHAMAEFFSPSSSHDHVPDPYYEGAEGFELVLDLLSDACQNLFNCIINQTNGQR